MEVASDMERSKDKRATKTFGKKQKGEELLSYFSDREEYLPMGKIGRTDSRLGNKSVRCGASVKWKEILVHNRL